jgi:hypothetical protein
LHPSHGNDACFELLELAFGQTSPALRRSGRIAEAHHQATQLGDGEARLLPEPQNGEPAHTPPPATPVALACDPGALDPATRRDHFTWISEQLPSLVKGISQLPDGIGLKFSAADLGSVATFVDRERRCCPFLRFDIELMPGEKFLWLRLRGLEGVERFLRAELFPRSPKD